MISIAVVGARGFVGSAVAAALQRDPSVAVTAVTRDTYQEARSHAYDVVINAAMPAARFWAKGNPLADFTETVQKTADIIYGWRFRRFVQISSVSARCQIDTIYGRHKAAAEAICAVPDALTIRLGPMYARTLSKGVLVDMLEGRPVFVAGESRYAFASLDFVATWIAANYERTGLVEVGARDAIALRDVARHLGASIEFRGTIDHQEVQRPEASLPSADEVLAFLDQWREERRKI